MVPHGSCSHKAKTLMTYFTAFYGCFFVVVVVHKTAFPLISNTAIVSASQIFQQRTPCAYLRDTTSCGRTAAFNALENKNKLAFRWLEKYLKTPSWL